MTKRVVIDPGHGGHDPGAVGNGLREKDIVLKIARYMSNYIKANYKGIEVKMTRNSDKFISLSGRAKIANDFKADAFVSIHINAGPSSANGYEDFIYNGNVGSNTKQLQNSLNARISKLFGRNRGKKRANFSVLRNTRASAVLTENGFISNKSDAIFLKKDNNLKKIGEAHAKAIAEFFGLAKASKKSSGGSKPKKSTKKKATSNITVDGYWGPATTRALQKALGTPADGIISNQYRNSVTKRISGGITWGTSGSTVIKALQRKVGATADGRLGAQTVRRLQIYLGTPVDGVISKPSVMVRELQRRLNAGTF